MVTLFGSNHSGKSINIFTSKVIRPMHVHDMHATVGVLIDKENESWREELV